MPVAGQVARDLTIALIEGRELTGIPAYRS